MPYQKAQRATHGTIVCFFPHLSYKLLTVDSSVWNSPRSPSLVLDCPRRSLVELRFSHRTLLTADFLRHYIRPKKICTLNRPLFKPRTNKEMSRLPLDRRHKVEVNSTRRHQGMQTPRLPLRTIALHIFSPRHFLFWIFSP